MDARSLPFPHHRIPCAIRARTECLSEKQILLLFSHFTTTIFQRQPLRRQSKSLPEGRCTYLKTLYGRFADYLVKQGS